METPTSSRKVERFEDLIIWQRAVELAAEIYLVTDSGSLRTDFALRDQLRRAAISISANIAEGFERRSRKEYLNFLNIAKGSAGEVRSLLEVAARVGCLSTPELSCLKDHARFLSGSIANHMKAISAAR
ncbi:MAG: four helix bundle protein [Pyrinomonadaceae bacterium]